MAYATVEQVEAGFRSLDADDGAKCAQLISEADIMIDSHRSNASDEVKRVVECRMVRRALGDGESSGMEVPMGATQGSMSALGYSQSWTIGSGSSGELYFSKEEKRMLGISDKIGASNPFAFMEDKE